MGQVQTIEPLNDDELLAVADDPQMAAKFTSEERRRLTRIRPPKQTIGASMNIGGRTFSPESMAAPEGAVTLGQFIDNPRESMQKIGAIVRQDLTDPKLWLSAALAYFGPKVLAMRPVIRQLATKEMLKDVATVAGGDSRVSAGLRIGSRVADAVKTSGAAPAAAPAAAAPAAPEPPPAVAPTAPSVPPSAVPSRSARAKASSPVPASEPAAAKGAAQAFDLNSLTDAEKLQANRWFEQGMKPEQIIEQIVLSRKLTQKLGTQTPDQVRRAVDDRNASGRWPE